MNENNKQENIQDIVSTNEAAPEETEAASETENLQETIGAQGEASGTEEPQPEPVNYQIRVHRRKSVMSALVAARVLIDGTEVGKVKNGEDAVFEVTPGKHVVLFYAGGERKCGAIFAPDPDGADIIIAPTINAWRMEIVGVLPLPKEELQVKPEELVEKQKLPEMDSATRRQIEHAMYGKRGRRG